MLMSRAGYLLLAFGLILCVGCTGGPVANRTRIEEWKRLREGDDAAIVPWSPSVRFPSRADWAVISARRAPQLAPGGNDSDIFR